MFPERRDWPSDPDIPDAVCDVQTEADGVLGPGVVRRIHDWLVGRRRLSAVEAAGPPFPQADEWHASDDDAAEIVNLLAEMFEIDPPWPDPSDGRPTATHVHRTTGESVVVTGHINGITIFDSEDESDEELLDYVFDELYEPAIRDLPPPDPEAALSFDECEAAGVDGTLRDM